MLNLQGDVVAILDTAGNTVVEYTYDAWGKLLSTTGSVEDHPIAYNPLRYRGYVYDTETQLYYLQSRYYDPEVGRFLNADALVSTGQGLLGNNMFAYCNNNPANAMDPSGHALVAVSVCFYDPSLTMFFGGGGGGGGSYAFAGVSAAKDKITKFKDFVTNESEEVVLESDYLSFYHGVPVFRVDFGYGGGLSFGCILLDDDYQYNEEGIKVLKHEYGHRRHMDDIGVINYTATTAIPSLVGAGLSSAKIIDVDYYSLPWEYVANMYGNVSHSRYTSWADGVGVLFWMITKSISKLMGGI